MPPVPEVPADLTEPQTCGEDRLARAFDPDVHLVRLEDVPWTTMDDGKGGDLWGIRGRDGAFGLGGFGHPVGVTYVEMRPGAEFPLHVHPGDHLLVAAKGRGKVRINGIDYAWHEGATLFIPGDYPHGVKTYPFEDFTQGELDTGGGLFAFFAVGHPAKHADARDRMQLVDPAEEEAMRARLLKAWGE